MAECEALRSLPANATDSARILARLDGRMLDEPVLPACASLRLESSLPVRSFFSWPGKRNYEGSWWSSTTCSHVGFESLLERDFLMFADYDRGVVGIASQPFAVLKFWLPALSGAHSDVARDRWVLALGSAVMATMKAENRKPATVPMNRLL